MFGFKTTCLMVLALGLNAVAGAASPAPQTINLERDCNGCPSGSRLVLHADGRVESMTVGKARLGTEDQLREGRFSIETFATLVQLAQARGFFDLDDEIADPEQQDGAWLLLRIDCANGRTKQVFNRGAARPPALSELVNAIEAATRDIAFHPTPRP